MAVTIADLEAGLDKALAELAEGRPQSITYEGDTITFRSAKEILDWIAAIRTLIADQQGEDEDPVAFSDWGAE